MVKVIANLGNYSWFQEQMYKYKNLYIKPKKESTERIKKPYSPVFKKKIY